MPTHAILTFPIIERPKAHRRHAPKTRTGCITCKKRRIRCDEGKPTCQNCTKSKRTCEGYVQNQAAIECKFQREYRPLLIKPNYESHVFTGQLQKDQFEYWMAFSKKFTLFPSDLVTQLIPQIAREEPAIRHAAFAIGAATLGSDTRRQRTSGTGPYMADAMQHYGRAIHIIRSSEVSRRSMPRALLSCLLFATFEAIQGNYKEALTHINHGCDMLDQVMQQGISGDCPPKLVDEVISGFQRFTLLSWVVSGYHPPETKKWVPWCCRGKRRRYAVDEMPDKFDDLSEARRWWEVVQHYVIYQTNMQSALRFEGFNAPTNMTQIPQEEIKKHGGILQRWHQRFEPLIARAEKEAKRDKIAYLQMISLRLFSLSLSISVKSSQNTNMEVLSASTPDYREVVSLSRILLEGQASIDQTKEVFTMDSSPTYPLLCVSMFCLDGSVREEAYHLMEDYPRRDGTWDTRTFAAMTRVSLATRNEHDWSSDEHFEAHMVNKEVLLLRNEVRRRRYALTPGGKWQLVHEQRVILPPD
ncbi:hypothetical protein EsH8_IX_000979 [Colletotrichum jinshuiense]